MSFCSVKRSIAGMGHVIRALLAIKPAHFNQGQPQVTHFRQQAMERNLVGNLPDQAGLPIVNDQIAGVEPGSTGAVEITLHGNAVVRRATQIKPSNSSLLRHRRLRR
jgi:hypothetical protein